MLYILFIVYESWHADAKNWEEVFRQPALNSMVWFFGFALNLRESSHPGDGLEVLEVEVGVATSGVEVGRSAREGAVQRSSRGTDEGGGDGVEEDGLHSEG